jgi:CO/xanthine dehydrogenase FAD-binding subunit
MYASAFDYVTASSWEEAVRLLEEGGDEAKAIAGGQSLVPMMTLRLATPALLIDVSESAPPGVTEADGKLVISATTRHTQLERSAELARACPLMPEAAALIGNVRVRHRGTIGGSLAHADPAAELPCAVVALGGTIHVLGPGGERRVPAEDFFISYYTSGLGPSEVVTAIEVPAMRAGTGWSFQELVRRRGDFAIVEVAALVELDPDGRRFRAVRLVLGGVGERPLDLSAEAAALNGEEIDVRIVDQLGDRVAASLSPTSNVHATSSYRREMAAVFVRRALMLAAERAHPGRHA